MPGMGVVVKAIQENSETIKDTYHAIKGILDPAIRGIYHLTVGTFKAIYNFLNPFSSHGLLSGLAKLFKGGTSLLSDIFSGIGNLLLGSFIRPVLAAVLGIAATFVTSVVGILAAFAAAHLIDILAQKVRDWLGRTPMKDWKKVLDSGDWFKLPYLGTPALTITVDPNAWWYKYLPGQQNSGSRSLLEGDKGITAGGQIQPASFNIEAGGIKLLSGFNQGFNTGIADKGDTVLELMKRQTELLSEILRALIGRPGLGSIRAFQGGGVILPGEEGLVGEAGPERLGSGGRSGIVGRPSVVKAGDSPVVVTPQTNPANYVSPLNNPNVNPETLEKYSGRALPASIRMNNPGGISSSTKWGGYPGDPRPGGEAAGAPKGRNWYTKFNTPEEGIQAQGRILADYGTNRGQDTLEKIIWGPKGAGHPSGGWADRGQAEYVSHLSKLMNNLDPKQKVDTSDPNFQLEYIKAASIHESGAGRLPYTQETYSRALAGTDPGGVSRTTALPQSFPSPFLLKPGSSEEKLAQAKQKGVYTTVEAANKQVTPPTSMDASLRNLPKAGPSQQPADLGIKRAGGESVSDAQRRNTVLRDRIQREQQRRPSPKTPAPEHHTENQSRSRTSPHRVAFTGVGPVAVSAGSGFS
jgi:hypothetical protein